MSIFGCFDGRDSTKTILLFVTDNKALCKSTIQTSHSASQLFLGNDFWSLFSAGIPMTNV